MISFDEFSKLDLKIGKILEANLHPNAEKLYVLRVDIGDKEISLVAGIKPFYQPKELINKLIAVLVNLEPKNIRGFLSEGMLLAAQAKEDLSLLVSDKEISPGSKIG